MATLSQNGRNQVAATEFGFEEFPALRISLIPRWKQMTTSNYLKNDQDRVIVGEHL